MTDTLTAKAVGAPPFAWTEAIEDEVFDRIMGGEALCKICGTDRDDWLPSERTFYKRLSGDDAFAQRYAQAREAQAHREFDQIVKIADDAKADDVHVARLRIDARKWRASKLAPKKYGEKLDLTSGDGTMSPKSSIDFSRLSTSEKKALLSAVRTDEPNANAG